MTELRDMTPTELGEAIDETIRTLITQLVTANSMTRNAAQGWREKTGDLELPAHLEHAWSMASDLQRLVEAVYGLTISLGYALDDIEKTKE